MGDKQSDQPVHRVRRRNNEWHVRDEQGRRVATIPQGVSGGFTSTVSYGYNPRTGVDVRPVVR